MQQATSKADANRVTAVWLLETIVASLERGDAGSKPLQRDLMDLMEEDCDENESIIPIVLVPSVESVK
jgi:hypothetical protein